MKYKKRFRRRKLRPIAYVLMGLIILLLIAIGFALKTLLFSNPENSDVSNSNEIVVTPSTSMDTIPTTPTVSIQPTPAYDTTTPSSITVIANKKHSIGQYAPDDLVAVSHPGSNGTQYMRQEAAEAMEQLLTAADNDGVTLYTQSGYRSYDTQVSLWQSYANRDGAQAADTYSSRAGYSDHQTGLAMDIMGINTRMNASTRSDCPIEQCEGSEASLWLAQHAADYGFIQRFPVGKQSITGYVDEWWHYRYVGVDLAKAIKESGLCMEEYFNVEGGDYAQTAE